MARNAVSGRVAVSGRRLIRDFGTCVVSTGAGNVSMCDNFKYTDKVTLMGWFIFNGSANMGNFPTLMSKGGNDGYFLISNPSKQVSFNFNGVAVGERSSGIVSSIPKSGEWHFY